VNPPAALLWDLDGTLVDSEPVHLLALSDVLAARGFAVPPELQQTLLGRSGREVHAYCVETFGLTLSYEELSGLKHEAYTRHAAILKPRAGAIDLFWELRRRSVPQAIVSNSDRILVDLNLRALGLLVPGLITVSRNDVRLGKPDPEPFLRAAHLLGIAPEECAVVEDSPVGATGGLAAGMRVICLLDPTGGAPHAFPPGAVVARDCHELGGLLGLAEPTVHPPFRRNPSGLEV
jgi:HAD superfamily hydrolase (TIGR01509 family)